MLVKKKRAITITFWSKEEEEEEICEVEGKECDKKKEKKM